MEVEGFGIERDPVIKPASLPHPDSQSMQDRHCNVHIEQ